jgi:hypothetical protein
MVVFCAHFDGEIQNFSEMKSVLSKPNAPAIPLAYDGCVGLRCIFFHIRSFNLET